jgi:UTP--glucose-1-phosphate uridylyltransferase
MTSNRVRTAIFPVAGMGTRFLPATKATPKELLPVIDRPLIQYAIDEARRAGIERMVFVSHPSKSAIERHLREDADLVAALREKGKTEIAMQLQADALNPLRTEAVFVMQDEPLGLGHAVLCAKHAVGNEPFFVHLADDLIYGKEGCLKQMRRHFEQHGVSVLGVETVPADQTGSYGIVAVQTEPSGAQRVTRIVEKPKPKDAPSNLAVVGRYILTPAIFAKLEHTQRGAGGEIQLTDGIASLLADEPVHVLPFVGVRYDCGSKIGYLRATVEYGLRHPELGDSFRAYLQNVWER